MLYLRSHDINVEGIIHPHDESEKEYDGVPYVNLSEVNQRGSEDALVIVTDPSLIRGAFRRRQVVHRLLRKWRQRNAMRNLKRCGINNCYFLRKSDLVNIYAFQDHHYYRGRMHYIRQHMEALKETYDMLCDEVSRETMVEYLRVFVQSGWYKLPECDGRNKYFAGYGRGENTELLYAHRQDEVWVNCGASIGDTVLVYCSEGYTAQRIYAFEGSKAIYRQLCNNVNFLPEQYRDKVLPINEFISEESNWDNIITEKITLINADIEGAELSLLHVMKERIKQDRPVVAICVYHKHEDLVEIPQFIDGVVENYKYLLRKYPCSVSNIMHTSELVLYAIPNERYVSHDK